MGHNHLNTIDTSSPCDHNMGQYQYRTNLVSTWMLLQLYTNNFSKSDLKW